MTDEEFRERYGPVALVTGASSGIGWAFAEALAARGMDLVLTARRRERLADLTARLTAAHGVKITVLPHNLRFPDSLAELLQETRNIDIGLVVSNAGFGLKGPHERNYSEEMTDLLMVNCNAPMQLARGFIPRLKARGRGGLLFTASVEGLMGCPYSAAYSASKALVIAFGEALWGELKPDGIDVLTLCPGATESEAAANQGIDIRTLSHVMPAADVARLALEHIDDGPAFFSSDHYREQFEALRAMPRREALTAMATSLRPA